MRTAPIADREFAGSELTLSLAGTLDMIGLWPGITAAGMSRKGPSTQQAVSQLVVKLEKLGYVERRVGGRRGVGLFLTAAGERARADANRREDELEQRLREVLGGDVYAQLVEQLQIARERLATRDNQSPSRTRDEDRGGSQ